MFPFHVIYKNPVVFDINLTEFYQNYWIFFHKYAKIIKVYMTKFINVLPAKYLPVRHSHGKHSHGILSHAISLRGILIILHNNIILHI